MAIGASMVMIPNARDLKDVLENINKYKPTIFPGVPLLYNGINNHPDVKAGKYDLSSIKACISGSAPLMRETKERFEELTGGKVFEGYGLSEAPTATHCNPLLGTNKTGSIGLPLPDVDVKIISLDDGETELQQGEIGEIAIHGPQVMKGYHNMPTETANTLRQLSGWTDLAVHRRHCPHGRGWLFLYRGPQEGADQARRLPGLAARGGGSASPRIPKSWRWAWAASRTRTAAKRSKPGSWSSPAKR